MKVYMVSRPTIVWDEWERFASDEHVAHMFELGQPASEALVELAGRLCYMSYGKGRKTTKEFIDNLIQSGHHSVLEHSNWTIFITGISRSCSHELVRHRHFSFSQLSQRYVDHSKVEMICPPEVEKAGMKARWCSFMDDARSFYEDLARQLGKDKMSTQERKDMRTIVRSVLPNATETKIAVTGNARAWRQFIQTRAIPAADPEIFQLAIKVHGLLRASAPLLFDDILSTRREPNEENLHRIAP